ncbi:MAG: glutamate--tRNA ligase family protein [Microbacterium sp.]
MPALPWPPARTVRACGLPSRASDQTDNTSPSKGSWRRIGVATLPRMALDSFPLLPGVSTLPLDAAEARRLHILTAKGAERVPSARPPCSTGSRRCSPGDPCPRDLNWGRCLQRSIPDHHRHLRADVRVRFCPSPTGLPHVGMAIHGIQLGLRPAHGGKLIFRVEDTDAARDSEESYRQLVEALTWLEIDWDEGVEKGGPHAPYRQSQRRDICRRAAAARRPGRVARVARPPKRSTPERHRGAPRSSSATTTSTAPSPTSRRRPSAPRGEPACACRYDLTSTST